MEARISLGRSTVFAVIIAIAISATGANAGISNTVLNIRAENDSGTSTFAVDFSEGVWNSGTGVYTWSLGAPVDLIDDVNSSISVAGLESASLTIQTGLAPSINLNLGVLAGATNTNFYADTAQVNFSTIPASMAEASFQASGQVWDNQFDGAFLVGLGDPGVGAFRSLYNGVNPTGTIFSHLLAVVMAGGGGSAAGGESYPQSGTLPVGDPVSDICIHAAFVVSGGDRMLGGGNFGVVPEPAALALLALGAATVLSQRRR